MLTYCTVYVNNIIKLQNPHKPLEHIIDDPMLLGNFFLNFTVMPIGKNNFKGSEVVYKLKEPWSGFLENDDFLYGAP